VVIWYKFCRFGVLFQEKSGNPGPGEPAEAKDLHFRFKFIQ
jgi:hypothetical protein